MSEVSQLQEQLKNEKAIVGTRDAIERLFANRDFRTVILEGFCKEEAARYVQESGDPMLSDRERADALNMAQASGHLKRFLAITCVMGNNAENQVKSLEQAIDEARSEGEDE